MENVAGISYVGIKPVVQELKLGMITGACHPDNASKINYESSEIGLQGKWVKFVMKTRVKHFEVESEEKEEMKTDLQQFHHWSGYEWSVAKSIPEI